MEEKEQERGDQGQGEAQGRGPVERGQSGEEGKKLRLYFFEC